MEMANGLPDGSDSFLGVVQSHGQGVFLAGLELFQFAGNLCFDRFGGGVIGQDGFEFELEPTQAGQAIRIVQGKASLQEYRVGRYNDSLATDGIHDHGDTGRGRRQLEMRAGPKLQRQTVDRLRWSFQQQVSHVIGALLVFEETALPVEC